MTEHAILEHDYPTWFLWLILIAIFLSCLIELSFLGIWGYQCLVKNQCVYPFFFGYGRFMAFPMMGFYSSSQQISTQDCFINGARVNCSDFPSSHGGLNGVCPGTNNKSVIDCIKEEKDK